MITEFDLSGIAQHVEWMMERFTGEEQHLWNEISNEDFLFVLTTEIIW